MVSTQFLIRSVEPRDLPDLFRLSRHLDSYNLPADQSRLRALIADSRRSFAGKPENISRAKYLFVLEDTARRRPVRQTGTAPSGGRVVGCSLIIAKHGTPGLPHLYMTHFVEKRTSATLRKTVEHRCLRLGSTEDGPTEVGGLVLLPEYRGRAEKLGHWLSMVRFLFMAAHAKRFQRFVLAEFLPAFLKPGRSPFWEYFGRKFTGLSYRQADRLSIDNKEFVLSLFPSSTIYQDFFPKDIVRYLGQVGSPSRPAARILKKIGFTYLQQIEPFDGGPYYGALTRSIVPVQQSVQVQARTAASFAGARPYLLLAESGARTRAMASPAVLRGSDAGLPSTAMKALALRPGDWLWAAPFRP